MHPAHASLTLRFDGAVQFLCLAKGHSQKTLLGEGAYTSKPWFILYTTAEGAVTGHTTLVLCKGRGLLP